VCRKLGLQPGMRVLDIGCGWGSFMGFAAERYGVRCVGITISEQQAELGRQRLAHLPVEFRLQDYREVDERFDRVVSLGMFEHVGHKNYPDYMAMARRCLADDGLFLLHTIGRNDTADGTDPWIDRYVFPNGELPSIARLGRAVEPHFVVEDLHNFGADYDRTLMAWHRNFEAAWPRFGPSWASASTGAGAITCCAAPAPSAPATSSSGSGCSRRAACPGLPPRVLIAAVGQGLHRHPRVELGPLEREEALHVAHVGVLREQALGQGLVGGHVGRPDHQQEIRPRRHAPALLHQRLVHRPVSKASRCSAPWRSSTTSHSTCRPWPASGAPSRAVKRSITPASRRRRTRRSAVAGDTWAAWASAWLVRLASACSRSSRRQSVASSGMENSMIEMKENSIHGD
jgi:SAM-dependent methyltransferase